MWGNRNKRLTCGISKINMRVVLKAVPKSQGRGWQVFFGPEGTNPPTIEILGDYDSEVEAINESRLKASILHKNGDLTEMVFLSEDGTERVIWKYGENPLK